MEKYKCTYCREYGNLPCEECDKKNKENLTMEKTKFIRVAVKHRSPEKGKDVIVISSNGKSGTCYFLAGLWHGQKYGEPKYWLEEIPDIEDEMLQMLEECKNTLMDVDWVKYPYCQITYEKIDKYLELK